MSYWMSHNATFYVSTLTPDRRQALRAEIDAFEADYGPFDEIYEDGDDMGPFIHVGDDGDRAAGFASTVEAFCERLAEQYQILVVLVARHELDDDGPSQFFYGPDAEAAYARHDLNDIAALINGLVCYPDGIQTHRARLLELADTLRRLADQASCA